MSEAPEPEIQEGPVCIGDKVQVQLKDKTSVGELKFVGRIKGNPKVVYGVELKRKGDGKNSGGTGGQDYFPCAPQKGVFVTRNKILKYKPAEGEEDRTRIAFGDRVTVEGQGAGTVRFMGYPQFEEGPMYGVELEKPNGRFNGSVEGAYYFTARNMFGTFVRYEQLTPLGGSADEETIPNPSPVAETKEPEEVAGAAVEADAAVDEQPAVEEKVDVEEQQADDEPSFDNSTSFIPALRNDLLLKFMIRQPNKDMNTALFDMYCQQEGGQLLKAAFPGIQQCLPQEQLDILMSLMGRFVDVPTEKLIITPYGCGPDGYASREALEMGLDWAFEDLLEVQSSTNLGQTIPSSFLRSLPIVSVPAATCAEKVVYDDLLDTANTGDLILFGGQNGIARLLENFSNSPFSEIAMVVKGRIPTTEGSYGRDESIVLVQASPYPCVQCCDDVNEDSGAYTVAAAEALEYLLKKKNEGAYAVLCPLTADEPEMLEDIRVKLAEFVEEQALIGSAYDPARDSFPINLRDKLSDMIASKDSQVNVLPSSGLVAAAYQFSGIMSSGRAATTFLPSSFSPSCAMRVGYRDGPYASVVQELYEGIQIGSERCIDLSTLPA